MTKHALTLDTPEQRALAKRWIDKAPTGWIMTVAEPNRTLEQNAKLWAMLDDVRRQVDHHGITLTADGWKWVFMHALRQEQPLIVPSLDGRQFIPVPSDGYSTRNLTKSEFSNLLELMFAHGAMHGVQWSDEAKREGPG